LFGLFVQQLKLLLDLIAQINPSFIKTFLIWLVYDLGIYTFISYVQHFNLFNLVITHVLEKLLLTNFTLLCYFFGISNNLLSDGFQHPMLPFDFTAHISL